MADLPATHPEALRALLARTLAGRADATAAVVCLCAAWCGTCRDFQPGFERAASAHPQAVFRWLDIEDEAHALGDLDIETFPTLVIGGADGMPRFAGPVPPQPGQIARLLQALGL
ncbi:MAG: thioredoxin family protein [Ottowia sp.]|uniref:thioredoxin family protein n=1 Tax=Ottowia sp. TaxID=1898956 RepID=UPI0039E27EFF